MNKSFIISSIVGLLLADDKAGAKAIIHQQYPHTRAEVDKRTYTMAQKMNQFLCDGFIDRYSGQKLLNPGILKVISHYFPDDFPYHPHWKMTDTHIAYWELTPTIDHIHPIAKGGEDDESNWVTTSMKNNSIKSHYSLDELQWKLYPKGELAEWDGLTSVFLELVEKDRELLEDPYIRSWYTVSKACLKKRGGNYQ